MSISEIRPDGRSIALTGDTMRARYRENAREPKLVTTRSPQRYDFEHFTFVSRQVGKGSRLRLMIAPINSIFAEKNYNSAQSCGRAVHERCAHGDGDAAITTGRIPASLYVPLGQP